MESVDKEEKFRIALAGLFEEVNTFADETMGKAKITGNMTTGFQQWTDQALIDDYKGSKTYMGGFIAALEEFPEVDIVPTTFWSFSAGGTIEGKAYQQMKQDILDRLAAAMPLDAVALCLHGAGVAEGVDDVETDLTAAIRKQLGPGVKVISAQDHHSNLSDEDVRQLDLLSLVYHYPHIDMYDTAYRAARLLPDMVKGNIKPYGHFERLPLIMQCMSTMDGNLYAPIRKKVEEFSKRDGIYEFSFAYGFPFADVPFNSPVVNCWATSPELAEKTAKEFAALLWQYRDRFVVKPLSAEGAVQQALTTLVKQGRILPTEVGRPLLYDESAALLSSAKEELERSSGFLPDEKNPGPIVIADKSDNPGAGAPGDATHLLRELIKNNVQQAAVCAIRNPETVQKAMEAGVGKIIAVELGGKGSKLGGAPIRGKAYVKSISDGRYTIVSPMGAGTKFDVGPAVGLLIEGVDVAVISGTMQAFDANQMKMVGFDPHDYRIVVVKSANHFRAWWTGIASQIIDCDAPGIGSNDLSTFAFKRKTRKVYPLDADAVYPEPGK
jgi:microcystin degradation protein MlrC